MYSSEERLKVKIGENGLPVSFDMPTFRGKHIEITIFDIQGSQVWSYKGILENQQIWNGEGLDGLPVSHGTYIYTVSSIDFVANGRIRIAQNAFCELSKSS